MRTLDKLGATMDLGDLRVIPKSAICKMQEKDSNVKLSKEIYTTSLDQQRYSKGICATVMRFTKTP